MVVNILFR